MISSELNYKKATQAINFFASKTRGKEINKMKAIKLIWLADRYHLRKYGRPVIGDDYIAMQNGPVGSLVRDIAQNNDYLEELEKEYRKKYLENVDKLTVRSINDVDGDVLSETDIEALDFALKNFSELSQFDLVELSHKYPEWAKFKDVLEVQKSASRKRMSYLDFFSNPNNVEDDKFRQDEEVTETAKEIFKEDYSIAQNWI